VTEEETGMSDLFDTLHLLVDVLEPAPLPPQEVRRRGDRMRRRRTARQALVATTVVAILVWAATNLLIGGPNHG
jgi:hypothetical protein